MASASSECDNLQVALNDKRCAEMGLGDEKLQRLDRLLDRCNKKHVGSGAQCHDASARCLRVIHAGDLPASVFIELVSFAPQGLGFCAGGRVLDRTTLEKIFASISGLFGTVIPLIVALCDEEGFPASATGANASACTLSAAQVAAGESAIKRLSTH